MRANPGGEIAPDEVVGRDRLVERLWQTLERQSVILVSERRMGKSCVNKKMVAEQPEGILAFYRDVENVDTPIGFAERFYHDVEEYLGRVQKTAGRVRALLRQLAGTEIGGVVKLPAAVAPHWKILFEKTVEDLTEHQGGKVVMFWDELPLMLAKIRRSAGETTAMEVLDTLRSLRQMHGGLRMIYTGSIGLHHVIASLRQAGHANDATNDMRTIEVPPLSLEDAAFLAAELLRGEGLASTDPEADGRTIARLVDCIPFYIHLVVSTMKDRGDVASGELAEEIVAAALVDPQDAWHLLHYRDRLEDYYGEERVPAALVLLDELSLAEEPLAFDRLHSVLKATLEPSLGEWIRGVVAGDRESLHRLLILLQRDHYLHQEPADGRYRFRFPLIRRWWRIHRNL